MSGQNVKVLSQKRWFLWINTGPEWSRQWNKKVCTQNRGVLEYNNSTDISREWNQWRAARISIRCGTAAWCCLEKSSSPYFLGWEKNFIKDNRTGRGMQMAIDSGCAVAVFQAGFELKEHLLLTHADQPRIKAWRHCWLLHLRTGSCQSNVCSWGGWGPCPGLCVRVLVTSRSKLAGSAWQYPHLDPTSEFPPGNVLSPPPAGFVQPVSC